MEAIVKRIVFSVPLKNYLWDPRRSRNGFYPHIVDNIIFKLKEIESRIQVR